MKTVGNVNILQKKVSWTTYKNNYDQDEIQYSKWGSPTPTNGLAAKTKQNYINQHKIAKKEYMSKFSGMEELNPEDLAQMELFNKMIEKDVLGAAAKKAMGQILADKKAFSDSIYKAIQNLHNARLSDSEAAIQKARKEIDSISKILRRLLTVSIPESLGMTLAQDSNQEKIGASVSSVSEVFYGSTMDSTALTSYLNSARILDAIEDLAKNSNSMHLNSTGQLVFQKYATSIASNLQSLLSTQSEFSEDNLKKAYKSVSEKKIVDKSSVVGSTIGRATGYAFEGAFGPNVVDVTLGMGKNFIEFANDQMVASGGEREGGKMSKPDYKIIINGKNVDLSKVSVNTKGYAEFDIPLPNIESNLSIKQDKKSKGSIYDNSTIGALFADLPKEGEDYQALLYHYFQLYSSPEGGSKGQDKATIDLVNRYVSSHLIAKAFGEGIDYIVFSDAAVSKYNYLQEISGKQNRMLRIVPKPSSMFMDIKGETAQLRNK